MTVADSPSSAPTDPMANRRLARLNELLKREISRILRHEVRDPRVGIPTVTGVEVTQDLWSAKVHVRLGGEEKERAEALEGLEAAAPYVRKQLGDLRIRRVPELRFVEDRTLDHARRIERILEEVAPGPEEGEEEGGEGEPDDTPPPTGGKE